MSICVLCDSSDDVEMRLVYPRHRAEDESPTARRLCERCHRQYHWQPATPNCRLRKGGPPGYGYRTVNGRVIKSPSQLATIARIIELKNAGTSWHGIVEALEAERRPTARGGDWHVQTVINIYRREFPDRADVTQPKHIAMRFGYASERGQVVVNEREQEVLRWMVRAREAGNSFERIAKILNHHKVPAKRGGLWYPPSVATILRREGL